MIKRDVWHYGHYLWMKKYTEYWNDARGKKSPIREGNEQKQQQQQKNKQNKMKNLRSFLLMFFNTIASHNTNVIRYLRRSHHFTSETHLWDTWWKLSIENWEQMPKLWGWFFFFISPYFVRSLFFVDLTFLFIFVSFETSNFDSTNCFRSEICC